MFQLLRNDYTKSSGSRGTLPSCGRLRGFSNGGEEALGLYAREGSTFCNMFMRFIWNGSSMVSYGKCDDPPPHLGLPPKKRGVMGNRL